jgi:hypothetical protein
MKPQLLATPTRVINFAQIMPLAEREPRKISLFVQPQSGSVALAPSRRPLPLALRRRLAPRPANLKPLAAEIFRVLKTQGSLSQAAGVAELATTGIADVRLPMGMPRFVNVATLKRMLNAKRSDTLLRRAGDRWEIAEDGVQVDLLDDTVEFRLGSIQIFS